MKTEEIIFDPMVNGVDCSKVSTDFTDEDMEIIRKNKALAEAMKKQFIPIHWTNIEERDTPMPNKYAKQVKSGWIDVYDILRLYKVIDPAIQHAIKKLLMPGQRGHKTETQDIQEAIASLQSYLTRRTNV